MRDARGRDTWEHTSSLMALVVNLVRDPRKSPPAKPADFNPYLAASKKPIMRGKQLSILKDVFVSE